MGVCETGQIIGETVVGEMGVNRLTDQGSPSVMQHIVSVESSSLLLHSYLT